MRTPPKPSPSRTIKKRTERIAVWEWRNGKREFQMQEKQLAIRKEIIEEAVTWIIIIAIVVFSHL